LIAKEESKIPRDRPESPHARGR